MADSGWDHKGIKDSLFQLFDTAHIYQLVPDLDHRISGLLSSYERRDDRLNVVLNSLLDLLLTSQAAAAAASQEEATRIDRQAGPMGCGASQPEPSGGSSDPASSMLCDQCQNKFSILNRKKTCSECGNYFCGNCLPRESGKTRTCARCRVLEKRPPQRAELMKLRVKDLRDYLSRKKINIKSCVEKKDLVELVLQNSGGGGGGGGQDPFWRPPNRPQEQHQQQQQNGPVPHSRSWEDDSIRVSDQVPLERSGDFPKSYVESSHRREWFERFGEEEEEEAAGGGGEEVVVSDGSQQQQSSSISSPPPPGGATTSSSSPSSPIIQSLPSTLPQSPQVEPATPTAATAEEEESLVINKDTAETREVRRERRAEEEEEEAERMEVDEEQAEEKPRSKTEDTGRTEPDTESRIAGAGEGPVDGGAVGGEHRRLSAASQDSRLLGEASQRLLGVGPLGQQSSASVPSSPRRFANQGLVYLSEIQSVDDLKELSARQAKEILAMNRVNFKGCVEKEELLKIVERLWRQERNDKEMLEKMEDDSLCKICMDAPIDCVMLECGHMCTCTNCGKQMAECPICRQYVVRVVRTFKA